MTSGSAAVASGCPVAPGGYEAPPQPLGPDSLTWKYFGDWRGMLQGPWAGSMQNMHPQLGAAVEEHSTFRREPWPRVLRSLYPIGGVVFDGDRAPTTGAEVRDYHTTIKGVDAKGRRYHALNPDVFYWAHSTFFVGTIHVAERFCGGITEDEKRQLFDEHVVPDVRNEHAAGAGNVGRLSGLLGSHVPRGAGRQQGHPRRPRSREVSETTVRPMGSGWLWSPYSDASSLRSWSGCASGCTTHQCANYWLHLVGRDEWLHRRFGDAVRLVFNALPGAGSIRGPAPVGIVRRAGFRPMRRWCTPGA